MRSESFDFCTEIGIPETDCAILTASENVLCAALGIAGDIDRAFVAIESSMQASSESLRTSGGSHESKRQVTYYNNSPSYPHVKTQFIPRSHSSS